MTTPAPRSMDDRASIGEIAFVVFVLLTFVVAMFSAYRGDDHGRRLDAIEKRLDKTESPR